MNHATRLFAVLSMACLFASTATAAPKSVAKTKHLLQYKFAAGEVLRYQVKQTTHVRTTLGGKTQEVDTRSESVKAWKVTDVLPSGEMEFIHLVESVHMTNKTPGQPANTYDSKTDKTAPRGFEQAAASVGVPLTVIHLAKDGSVVSREEKHPQPKPNEDLPITLILPKDPIAVGEKWSRTYDVVAERKGGVKQQVRTRRQCRLRSVRAGVATIEVGYEILSPVDSYVRSQLVDRLSDGIVRFDIAKGRIVAQEHNIDRRVLGFAGEASSMHFLSRTEETLLKPTPADSGVKLTSKTE